MHLNGGTTQNMSQCRGRIFYQVLWVLLLVVAVAVTFEGDGYGLEGATDEAPARYGAAVSYGHCFRPVDEVAFAMATAFGSYRLDSILKSDALELWRLKVEASLGSTYMPESRFMASVNLLAVYYLDRLFRQKPEKFRPYVDAGAGGIYMDFRIEGQGSRFNFNPIVSLGAEFKLGAGPPCFVAFRYHHISNANIDNDNRGANSLMLMVGRYF